MTNRLRATDDVPTDAVRVGRGSITLVHGTWGRGFSPKISELRRRHLFRGKEWWFEEGSQFWARLNEALNAASLDWPVRAFLWSGANSVHARDCAAKELSEQLRKDLQDPDATAVVIAHSHGGNVALRALQHIDSMAGRIRIVTLATPFLRVFARRSFQLPWLAKMALWGATCIVILGLSLKLDIMWAVFGKVGLLFDASMDAILAIYLVFLVVAVFFIVEWLVAVFTNPHAALAIEEVVHYDTKGAAASRMLVIRGVDDEASLSLAAGLIGSRLSFLILVGVVPAILFAFGFITNVDRFFGLDLESGLGTWFTVLVYGSLPAAFILFFVPGAFKSFFGREFLVSGMTCNIAVDSVPDTLGQVEAITLRPVEATSSKPEGFHNPYRSSKRLSSLRWLPEMIPSWQLRHGIYNHPDCVDEIVRWLRRVT